VTVTDQTGQPTERAYIGSFTADGGRGVTTAALDTATGGLRALHHTDAAVPNPSYLLVAGDMLYTVCETESGAAAALSLADPDAPAPLGEPVAVDGESPTHLATADGRLFTANYGSGSVSAVPLRADGTLGGRAAVHRHRGDGPVRERQQGPHAHAVVPDPSGRWLLSVDLGTDGVWVYRLGEEITEPGAVHEVRLRPGSGPRHLRFHPDGTHAYLVNELDPTLTVCRWDADRGVLEPLREVRIVPGNQTGPAFPSEFVIRSDGRFAWAATRGADSITVLALDATGESAEVVGSVSCGGHWPRDLALHPGERWLYAANERSGDVTWFALDETTGMPRRAGSLTAPAASCVVFR
jgi:6-phosphogluconolactonase (cycloisomerase 2 family)